ncbi:MAG: phosphatidate cytidylyltransferase [Deltaproteobacteria bacterium]|nr:phosphatidate cytidylyltransferase [Deltaproteobacteria bacterium]
MNTDGPASASRPASAVGPTAPATLIPKKDRSGLGWRFISAGVLIPMVVSTVFWLPPWTLLAFCGTACIAAGWEAVAVLAPCPAVVDPFERFFATTLTVLVGTGAALFAKYLPPAVAGVFPAVFLLCMALLVFRPREITTFSHRAAALVFVPLYVGLGLAVYPTLRLLFVHGDRWVFAIMALTFLGDTFAYFAGRFLGRHKLHPRLSPKKTWEGSMGGLLGSATVLVTARLWYLPELEWMDVALLALLAGAIGQTGDLFESALKRSVGVKDSGTILPGHGGLLDRIDALLPTGLFVLGWGLARGLFIPLGR